MNLQSLANDTVNSPLKVSCVHYSYFFNFRSLVLKTFIYPKTFKSSINTHFLYSLEDTKTNDDNSTVQYHLILLKDAAEDVIYLETYLERMKTTQSIIPAH